MSFEIIFAWRSWNLNFHNMWAKYRQIQISWLWFYFVIEKKWMHDDERQEMLKARRKKIVSPEFYKMRRN